MAKIIVTGGGGQLASEFSELAVAGEHDIVIASHAELDITSSDSIASFLDAHAADVVINCAAYTAVDRAESEPTEAYRVNAEGVALLAKEVASRGIMLIHISTDYVFSGMARLPYGESESPAPQSVYGETKLQGEREMQESGCRGIIIRTGWLYSSYGGNFVKTIAHKAQSGESLRVVADQWGTPTYAADLARAILKIIPQISERKLCGEIFHYSNDGETSWWEFADTIVSLMGSDSLVEPITTNQWPVAARRPEYSVLNKSKIKSWFGVEVPDWEISLGECLRKMGLIED